MASTFIKASWIEFATYRATGRRICRCSTSRSQKYNASWRRDRRTGTRLRHRSKRPMLRRPSIVSALALLAVLGVCAAVIAVFAIHNSLKVPRIERPAGLAWLPQNWTEDQRHRYYHTAQGSDLLPYAWFLALEQPRFTIRGAPPFRENSYLEGFGFIPDSADLKNPDGLPVGFARDDRFVDPYTGRKTLCSALRARHAIRENCSLVERPSGLTPVRR